MTGAYVSGLQTLGIGNKYQTRVERADSGKLTSLWHHNNKLQWLKKFYSIGLGTIVDLGEWQRLTLKFVNYSQKPSVPYCDNAISILVSYCRQYLMHPQYQLIPADSKFISYCLENSVVHTTYCMQNTLQTGWSIASALPESDKSTKRFILVSYADLYYASVFATFRHLYSSFVTE